MVLCQRILTSILSCFPSMDLEDICRDWLKNLDRIITIDLDYQLFPTVESLAQKLVQDIQQQQPGFGQHYQRVHARRDGLLERYRELQSQWASWKILRSSSEKEIEVLLAAHTSVIKHTSLQEAEFGKLYTPPPNSTPEGNGKRAAIFHFSLSPGA